MDKKMFQTQLGRRLRIARESRGLSQTALARLIAKSKQQISALECGSSMMLSFDAVLLAQLLSVDLRWLLTGRR